MSPSPACSKPPPPQLSLLISPLPDPPDKNYHMISPQIYEDEHGFFDSTNTQADTMTLILEKINTLEKQLTHRTLPSELTTLLNRLCDKFESLAAKPNKTDKMIKTLLMRLEYIENHPTNKQKEVRTSSNRIDNTNVTLPSFAAVLSATNNLRPANPQQQLTPQPLQIRINSRNTAL
ncbi:hypothetical protein O181_003018 [Austropuccinia psidii MF-1]|uniref:Uncharacterized protein n=1 Tax=Austropuccinia psidii MF-1 TaxID=1389203 RepID=A0A9Q3BDU8_9BASI|nr:hypothetical protein [Austropuccinia psidii MF-1]